MFVAFTPIALPAGSSDWIADPSRRTCIVSLINAHDRPFRLKLKESAESRVVSRPTTKGSGLTFGDDLKLMSSSGYSCRAAFFQLDDQAECDAGLPPLLCQYDKTLLSGVDDKKDVKRSTFTVDEVECYTFDG